MATLAADFRRPEQNPAAPDTPREYWHQEPDLYQLRPLPCEDVYLFCKKIRNDRLVREADPQAGRSCWRAVTMTFAAALFIMILMLPDTLAMVAGYRIHDLEKETARLELERSQLVLEEARLLNPENLRIMAETMRMVDPDSAHVVYLGPKTDTTVALNTPAKQ